MSRLHTNGETEVGDDDDIPSFRLTDPRPAHNSDPEDTTAPPDAEPIDFLELEYDDDDHLLLAQEPPEPTEPVYTPITTEELLTNQLHDAFCSETRRRLERGVAIPFKIDDNGLLVRTVQDPPQVVVPHNLKKKVLHINHHTLLAGHPGGKKLYHRIRKDYYWPSLTVDCYTTVRLCPHCARNRIKLRRNVGELKLFPANAPLESVCIDILGELIRTPRGNRYLLVIVDRFTKMVRTIPVKTITAAEVAKHFVHDWIFHYGPPVDLIADNGKQFTAKFFQDVCRTLNVNNIFTTTYHPQTNGQVERFNRTILSALRTYIADHPKDWDLYTDAITYAYNCKPQTSTSVAQFDLVLSRPPPEIATKAEHSEPQTAADFKNKWNANLQQTLATARKKLLETQARYKRNYDNRLRRTNTIIKPDDFVFLRV